MRVRGNLYKNRVKITGGHCVTKQKIYTCIVELTSELYSKNIAKKIFRAAKKRDAKNIERICANFEKENSRLYKKIVKFGKKYNKQINKDWKNGEIFAAEEDKKLGRFVFDTNLIDSMSFFVFICLANIDNIFLFEFSVAEEAFAKALEEAGYKELAKFVGVFSWIDWVGKEEKQYSTWYKLLIGIFKGEISN